MNPATASSHLATITPVDQAGSRALSIGFTVLSNLFLVALPTTIGFVGVLMPLSLAIRLWKPLDLSSALAVLGTSTALSFLLIVLWVTRFPEWPMNRWLDARLRKRCRIRCGPMRGENADWISDAVMCEYVRRVDMQATLFPKFETASDLVLVTVSVGGVCLEGDRARYQFPAASLLGATVESLRLPGCFHRLHYICVVARTVDGTEEFPISPRDCTFGRLSSKKRLEDASRLAEAINEVATGAEDSIVDPDFEGRAQAFVERSPRPHAVDESINPYAAPRS
ncbi:hypothetical protein U8335_16040 [Roseiconus lacunae]|uniref:hypothetical protein n=1 Tax=Roseiconus lacunae TaxID=2605694 RepID=UPI0030853D9E|nr:hypothetical protein U8335_16040 [Stieleria sp. HD01]